MQGIPSTFSWWEPPAPQCTGGTGLSPKGGSQPTTEPRCLTSSPLRGLSPQLCRCASPRASPKVVRNAVEGTPMSDSVPWARVGPQEFPAPTRHQPTTPAPWTSSFTVLAKLQHWDILCHRSEILVAGRLAHFLPFWREVIQANHWVLEVISQGYSRIAPDSSVLRGQEHTAFTSWTRQPIRRGGRPAKEGSHKTSSSRPGEEWFLQYLFPRSQTRRRPQAHLESESQVCNSSHKATPVDVIVDLKDVYFHIGVVPAHHQYLRFHWLGQSYQFGALPFRLSSAPRIFTKTLAPLVAWLRLMGVQLYQYLDDILILGESSREIEHVSSNNPPGTNSSRVHSEPEEVRSGPHPGSGVHRGQVQDGPGQCVPAGGPDRQAPSTGQILLQDQIVQDSSPLPGPTGPHGSHFAVGGVRPPSHASHPVVSEAALEPCNP